MSNQNKKQAPKPQNEKKNQKQYSRPELQKHGNVEKVTQFTQTGPSGPVSIDRQ